MKKLAIIALFAAALCCHAQNDNTDHVKGFPGQTVGQMLTNAMNASCANTQVPCFLVLDPSLSTYATGNMPTLCGNCFLEDYRAGFPWVTNTLITPVVCANNHNTDSTSIQSALNAGGIVEVSGFCNLSAHLAVYSHTRLDLTKATLYYYQTVADWVIVNEAGQTTNLSAAGVGAQRSWSDGATTAGSNVITSASGANFTQSDVGQSIGCTGAGGGGQDYHASIASFVNSTSVVVDDPVEATTSGATCYISVRDQDITIEGGQIILAGPVATTNSLQAVKIKQATSVFIENVSIQYQNSIGLGHVIVQDSSNVHIADLLIGGGTALLQDGVDLFGPDKSIWISGQTGSAGDDFIALTNGFHSGSQAFDNTTYGWVNGVFITDIRGTSVQGKGGVDAYLTTFPGGVENVWIDGVWGDPFSYNSGGNPGFGNGVKCFSNGGTAVLQNLHIANVGGWLNFTPINLSCNYANNVTIREVTNDNTACNSLISVGASTIVTNLLDTIPAGMLSNCSQKYSITSGGSVVNYTQVVQTVSGTATIPAQLSVGTGATLYQGASVAQLAAPGIISVVANGTCGSCTLLDATTYCWEAEANGNTGHTSVGAETCFTTPSTGNKNRVNVTINQVNGAASYNLYRGVGSGNEVGNINAGVLAPVSGALVYIDTGSAQVSNAPPAGNTTVANMTVAGSLYSTSGSTTLSPATGISGTTVTTNIVCPATSTSFAGPYRGYVHLVWQQLTTLGTLKFWLLASAAPSSMYVDSESSPGTYSAPYPTTPLNITSTTATQVTPSLAPSALTTDYTTDIHFLLTPSAATTITVEANSASGTLSVEPGSFCDYLP